MSADELAQAVANLRIAFLSDCCSFAACAIYLYDRCLVASREVDMIRSHRNTVSLATGLYFVLQLSMGVYQCINVMMDFLTGSCERYRLVATALNNISLSTVTLQWLHHRCGGSMFPYTVPGGLRRNHCIACLCHKQSFCPACDCGSDVLLCSRWNQYRIMKSVQYTQLLYPSLLLALLAHMWMLMLDVY
ncbi:hypothetical protein DAEQUDRAFT_524986 [Daedalea quercina L-15889]|uniref:Uncharacterized protein n=1 Tax=Daedalea quercina L-15889 TaxID=1314783 RepID=A0A165MBT6_9APHY|nr:hypothetical protein DAEQUDRAFT_524986 [Daedalea quercina L-15889]